MELGHGAGPARGSRPYWGNLPAPHPGLGAAVGLQLDGGRQLGVRGSTGGVPGEMGWEKQRAGHQSGEM